MKRGTTVIGALALCAGAISAMSVAPKLYSHLNPIREPALRVEQAGEPSATSPTASNGARAHDAWTVPQTVGPRTVTASLRTEPSLNPDLNYDLLLSSEVGPDLLEDIGPILDPEQTTDVAPLDYPVEVGPVQEPDDGSPTLVEELDAPIEVGTYQSVEDSLFVEELEEHVEIGNEASADDHLF